MQGKLSTPLTFGVCGISVQLQSDWPFSSPVCATHRPFFAVMRLGPSLCIDTVNPIGSLHIEKHGHSDLQ
jgi:hypothetical protein